ncbi:MAG TPA: hypothetical protein VGN00_22685 [Puia sp.]|jgi:uncharacterized protein YdaT
MPWYNGDYPPSYKNQPIPLREKAVEIANELLLHGAPEGVAIATGLKKARDFFAKSNRLESGKRVISQDRSQIKK